MQESKSLMSETRPRTTLKDIAEKVGTSTATVSRVLSKSAYPVSMALRRHILQSAADLDYSPSLVGQSLKSKVSRDIGIIVPSITNPFYANLLLGAETEARRQGYNVMLCISGGDIETEHAYGRVLQQKQVAGLIISTIGEQHGWLEKLQREGMQVVTFDQNVDNSHCHRVGFDFLRGGMLAAEHLISLGHRKIAFLSTPLNRRSRCEQLEGYRLAMLKNSIPFSQNLILVPTGQEDAVHVDELDIGRRLAGQFLSLQDRPSAIIAVNDMLALSIMQSLIFAGLKIPQDVSIIGFDDLDLSSLLIPPLTTVRQPAREMGQLASQILLGHIAKTADPRSTKSGDEAFTMITMEPQLVIRQSTGSPRAAENNVPASAI
jgi:LacI family transcriptional regulator